MTDGATPRKKILFLCIHNSCRSQMAEGLLRELASDRFEAFSAGLEATRVHPMAARVMAERGIDVSQQHSKTIGDLADQEFACVVTTCSEAQEACPTWHGTAEMLHWPFPDPAAAAGAEEERLAQFRAIRDAIEARIRAFVG